MIVLGSIYDLTEADYCFRKRTVSPGGIRAGGRGEIDLSRVLLHRIDSSGSASCPPAEPWGRGQVTWLWALPAAPFQRVPLWRGWQWGAVTSLETMTTGNLGHDCQEQFFHTVKSAEKHCCRHLACPSAPQWFGGSSPCFWHRCPARSPWAGKPWGGAVYLWGSCTSVGAFQVVTDVTLRVLFLGVLTAVTPL